MAEDAEDQLINFIKQTLNKNGFPQKKVSLPHGKIISAAESKGVDLDFVFSRLRMGGIYHEIIGEKIVFSDSEPDEPGTNNPFSSLDMGNLSGLFGGLDFNNLKNMSNDQLQGQVANFMENMTPEQQEQILKMYANMSDEDKKAILSKGKDLGLF